MDRPSDSSALAGASALPRRPSTVCAILLLPLALAAVRPAHGQADSTDAAPDTTATPPDSAATPPGARPPAAPDSAKQGVPDDPVGFRGPVYGRPVVDSLPAITPHVGVEHVLAQQPGTFLYDLGAVGWPHGWSPEGLAPHRSRLWLDGRSYTSPLTGRPRFDLLPPSFLRRPGTGVDPGGDAVGVHAAWRGYDQIRPITELRYRTDSNGQQAIEVAHSQKHAISLFGNPGVFQATRGYGGRAADGAYTGSDLRRERRLWGRLRYQRDDWAVELSDFSVRHRIGAHSGVVPPEGAPFASIYLLPRCEACSQAPEARRVTFRNDLTARVRAPLLPGADTPMTLAATWTSNTADFRPGSTADTTWTTRLNGGHGQLQQSLRFEDHVLTLTGRGSVWSVADTNVPTIDGQRWAAHGLVRDSLEVGPNQFVLDAGWHVTTDQQYPSASVDLRRPVGPARLSASAALSGQRRSWFETAGFPGFVTPHASRPSTLGQMLRGRVGLGVRTGPFDLEVETFAHQIRAAADLYASPPAPNQRVASTDSVIARSTADPVRRVGATATLGWRRDAEEGLYATGTATALHTLSDGASRRQLRLARTLPTLHGRGRIGARFVIFVDLITDLYVQARGWTAMNSRWFHPPTGRLVVPPAATPVPARGPGRQAGPSGTVDIHAERKLRGATLFLSFENVQSTFAPAGSLQRQTSLVPGTFVVPVYPLPARQFRFGVHWPIFD